MQSIRVFSLFFFLLIFFGKGTAAKTLEQHKDFVHMQHALSSGKLFQLDPSKYTLVIFLSDKCPCSKKHLPVINALHKLDALKKKFNFLGIYTSPKNFLSRPELKAEFTTIVDRNLKWVKLFGAYRTPHAFLLDQGGKVLYQGGVTNSGNPERASSHYLKKAMFAIDSLVSKNGPTVKRVFGCPIKP